MPEDQDQDQLRQHVSFAAGSLSLLRAADGAPATDEDGDWIVEGLAIPYGVELSRVDWQTGATRWTFEHVEPSENAKLYFGHDHLTDGLPIGRVVEHEQRKDGEAPGLFLRAKISRTAKGAEVRTLLQDGVLDRFSVGLDRMHPDTKTRVDDADSDNPLLVFEHVPAWETSVVPLPAYDQAKISAVLDGRTRKDHKMPENDDQQLLQQLRDGQDTLSSELQNVQRQLVTLGQGAGDAGDAIVRPSAPTYGDWLQQLAAGDQNALDFLAFVGSETADLDAISDQVAWVDDLRRSSIERRPVTQLFRRRPLPAKGMHVGFGRVLSDGTVQVAEQLNEGDTLAYGKLAFDAGATTPVRTAGGWTDMSRQVIERSDVGIVEDFFRVAYNRYLRVTESAVRTLAANPANATAAQTTAANDLTTADGWIDFLVDAAFYLDDNAHPLDFLAVSRDRFKALAKLRDGEAADAPRLLDRNSGRINVTGLNGDMFGVTVVPLNVPGDVVRAGSSDAITFWEDGRAPFRLQDDDITNLTSAFSLYGYYALASTDATAIVRPTVAGDVV